MVKKIVRGSFRFAGENHGRPYYQKDEKFNDLDVLLYFWDDRDGSDFSGWWFGPKVGGDQVWAYQPGEDPTPPETGWKVPYDGPVDKNFTVTAKKEKAKKEGKEAKAVKGGKEGPEKPAEEPLQAYSMWYGMPGMPGMPYMDPHAAERHMQEYARLHQEEAKRRLELEFQRQKAEEQKRKEAERKRKEEIRKKQEEVRKKKEEEMKRQKELQEQRIKEGKAVFMVRKVIQKVAAATPENLEALEKELEECLKEHLEDTGSQKDHMKSESDKCLDQAKKRIEMLNEAKRKAQEKKEADEKKRQEMEQRAKELLMELSQLLDTAETGVERLKEVCAPLEQGDTQSQEEVDQCAAAVEAAGTETRELVKNCMDFLVKNGPEMKDPPSAAVVGTSEIKQLMAKCLSRINECTKLSDALVAASRAVQLAVARRATASQETSKLKDLFNKYDVDGDQMLSKQEVLAFAKAEFQLTLSVEVLDKLWPRIVEDQKGVLFERLHVLKCKLGMQRELLRDQRRKERREARDKVRAVLREQLDTKVQRVERDVEAVEEAVVKVEKSLPPLEEEARKSMDVPARTAGCKAVLQDARDVAGAVQQKIDDLPSGFEERHLEDVKDLLIPDLRVLSKRMARFDLRLRRIENLCRRFDSEVLQRQRSELYGARLFAVKVARLYAAQRSRNMQQLYSEMDASGDGVIDAQEFSLFFMSMERGILDEASAKEVLPEPPVPSLPSKPKAPRKSVLEPVQFTDELLSRLFKSLLAPGSNKLSEEAFAQIMRCYFKVVKEGPITSELQVTGTNSLRQAKPDEVAELLEGPAEEPQMKVWRVRCRFMADGMEGFMTLRGTDGVAHLQDWRALFKILRDVQLTEKFERPVDKKYLQRTLGLEEEEEKVEREDGEPSKEPEIEIKEDENLVLEEPEETQNFDPEDPEGGSAENGGAVPSQEELSMPVGFQLLKHVDSPEPEEPDEGFRRLREGELVEVLQWPSNHLESGLTRMKVQALSDGSVGWITQTNTDGIIFAEPH